MTRLYLDEHWNLVKMQPPVYRHKRPNGCINENGNPKIRFMNAPSAQWYADNTPRVWAQECEAYECDQCGGFHIGHPPNQRYRTHLWNSREIGKSEWIRIKSLAELGVNE